MLHIWINRVLSECVGTDLDSGIWKSCFRNIFNSIVELFWQNSQKIIESFRNSAFNSSICKSPVVNPRSLREPRLSAQLQGQARGGRARLPHGPQVQAQHGGRPLQPVSNKIEIKWYILRKLLQLNISTKVWGMWKTVPCSVPSANRYNLQLWSGCPWPISTAHGARKIAKHQSASATKSFRLGARRGAAPTRPDLPCIALSVGCRCFRGNLLLKRDKLEEAIHSYQQAIHYRPSLARKFSPASVPAYVPSSHTTEPSVFSSQTYIGKWNVWKT